eukprot:gene13888-16414_t
MDIFGDSTEEEKTSNTPAAKGTWGSAPAAPRWVIEMNARGGVTTSMRCSYFAVFDGHGGRRAADLAAERLHANVLAAGLLPKPMEGSGSPTLEIKAAKKAVIQGYRTTDEEVLQKSAQEKFGDGATAITAWVVGDHVLLGNVEPEALRALLISKEHKAIYPNERARIEKAGGHVTDGRLLGRIEVSRSIGDRHFKKVGMSATPDVSGFRLTPVDKFMILGCDGFWGVFGPQDAVDFVASYLKEGRTVKAVCNRILNE